MQPTIRQYAEDAMRNRGMGSYIGSAGPVLDALEQREVQIADHLMRGGRNAGANGAQVEAILIESGLVVADPVPAAVTNGSDSEVPAWAQDLVRAVGRLADIARTRLGVEV